MALMGAVLLQRRTCGHALCNGISLDAMQQFDLCPTLSLLLTCLSVPREVCIHAFSSYRRRVSKQVVKTKVLIHTVECLAILMHSSSVSARFGTRAFRTSTTLQHVDDLASGSRALQK